MSEDYKLAKFHPLLQAIDNAIYGYSFFKFSDPEATEAIFNSLLAERNKYLGVLTEENQDEKVINSTQVPSIEARSDIHIRFSYLELMINRMTNQAIDEDLQDVSSALQEEKDEFKKQLERESKRQEEEKAKLIQLYAAYENLTNRYQRLAHFTRELLDQSAIDSEVIKVFKFKARGFDD